MYRRWSNFLQCLDMFRRTIAFIGCESILWQNLVILYHQAVTIPGVSIRQVPIIKGDAKSISIGAASIVAKVTRDRLMVEYDKILPQYGFASNKGYGSAEHIKALQEVGPSPIHRASFIKNFV